MSCCHEKEAKDLRQRNQALQNEISDLTSELAQVEHARYEVDGLKEELSTVVEAVQDHARGILALDELVEITVGRRS